MDIAMIVNVLLCELVDIVPLLFLITTSNDDTAVVEHSGVKHRMTASVMEIAMIVNVLLCELVDIVPLLFLITTSNDDTAVVEHSGVKHMFR